ncbi:MAG: sigma-54-dependent transcriptional regulator [Bacteroidota bacterium]
MSNGHILIIDDDVDICTLLQRFLERKDYRVTTAFKGKDGVDRAIEESVDLVLTDFRLPDLDGIGIIQEIKAVKASLPIIVITGYSDVNQAVKSIQEGAFEYVTKPIYPEEILNQIESAMKPKAAPSARINDETEKARQQPPRRAKTKKQPSSPDSESEFLKGSSAKSQNIQNLIKLVAPTDMTVVIIGESGTGKEIVARMIHETSHRSDAPFVAVDCGALTQNLAASELFGHVKGSFTGATSDKKGHFETANGGTLFLDEIGNLSYENQVNLLRVLQERVIRRVGSEKDVPVDVRIIVATNEDLKSAMRSGKFREDIYYRINEFKIRLPALKENLDDLEDFISFFIDKANQELDKNIKGVEYSVMRALKKYAWPGNIRELKNVMKRAVLLSQTNYIKDQVLPEEITDAPMNDAMGDEESLELKDVVANAEIKAIKRALKQTGNNKSKCAEVLGIDRKTLYNKMNAYGLLE